METPVSPRKMYIPYAIGTYFILSGVVAVARILSDESGLDRQIIETIIFQGVGIIAGCLLVLRRSMASYFFIAYFVTHIMGRWWALFFAPDNMVETTSIVYMLFLITFYCASAYFLFWLRKWGYYLDKGPA